MRLRNPSCAIFLAVGLFAVAIPTPVHAQQAQPVLMVIANQDFYYREYADTRSSLEAMGLDVVVAAATTEVATPHSTRPGGPRPRRVRPDIAITDASANDYSAIVFVGGWGASSYQYAFEGTYDNAAYRPIREVVDYLNRLIGDFVSQGKYTAAICNGVTVLAWARVDGVSPLEGHEVVSWSGGGPGFELNGQHYADSTVPVRSQIEANGGVMPLSAAVGDPLTFADDVIVDGRIITAENFDSASYFGTVLAQSILSPQARR